MEQVFYIILNTFVGIQSTNLLNSKSEYNQCAIPRLTSKQGENQYRKWEEDEREEKKKEELLEIKIRKLRKDRNKKRREEEADSDVQNKDQAKPTQKKRKIGEKYKEQEEKEKGQQDIRVLVARMESVGGAEDGSKKLEDPTPIGVECPGPALLVGV